jgi:hypothetical protein
MQPLDGRAYLYTLPVFDRPVSASIPRLLAPETPSWPANAMPYLVAAAGLVWAARRIRRARSNDDDGAALLLLAAALVACVVTSPSGWAMGFVWGLPVATVAWTASGADRLAARPRWMLRTAWIACALPPLFAGWAAIAGTAFVVAAAGAAIRWVE